MMIKDMTDEETVIHLRKWVQEPYSSVWAWPTDACGYNQHIKFVNYRNKYWLHGDYPGNIIEFILEYANKLEKGEV